MSLISAFFTHLFTRLKEIIPEVYIDITQGNSYEVYLHIYIIFTHINNIYTYK